MGNSGYRMDAARFAAAARASDGAAAVVVAGDLVNVWDDDEYIAAAHEVLDLFDAAPGGVHVAAGINLVPGNHDVDSHATDAAAFLGQLQHYRQTFGADYHSFETELGVFVLLNSELLIAPDYGADPLEGRWDTADPAFDALRLEAEAQWEWLEATLAAARQSEATGRPRAPHRRILPVMHHPPFVAAPDEPPEYFNWPTAPRSRLLALFAKHQVSHRR
jgi:3',5'-cyclic AMP phosphodiesterase CpdA